MKQGIKPMLDDARKDAPFENGGEPIPKDSEKK